MGIASVLLMALLADVPDVGPSQTRSFLGAVLILGLSLSMPGALYDLLGFANALQHNLRHNGRAVLRLDAPGLTPLIFEGDYPGSYWYDNGPPMVRAVNEGIHLLQANTSESDRIVTLGYVNPFPACLKRPSPRGWWVWVTVGFNVAEGLYPPAKVLFAEADAVMVPKYDSETRATTDALLAHYSGTLQTDYIRKAESPLWILYTRRTPAP